jgi:uncharacterized protein (UPF0335 family)
MAGNPPRIFRKGFSMSDVHGVARDQLRAFIERIERLEEEKKTIADDIKDVYGEAKGMGYDTVVMKKVIALRKKDDQERMEEELILDTYLAALGMIPEPSEEEPAPVAAAPTRQAAKPLQVSRKTVSVSAKPAFNKPGTANETVGGFPVAAAPTSAEETGGVDTDKLEYPKPRQEKETIAAASCEYCDGTGDVHRIDGEWLGYCHCEEGQRLKVAPVPQSAPASQGEAEAPSVESISPEIHGSTDANTGGDHEVDAPETANPYQAGGLVSKLPPAATYVLRPNCIRPENCAGHGSKLCHACTVAMRESEDA